jgi:hypothetical protein
MDIYNLSEQEVEDVKEYIEGYYNNVNEINEDYFKR